MRWHNGQQYLNEPTAHEHRATRRYATRQRAVLKKRIAAWNDRIDLARPRFKQTLHLIELFGGILPFAIAIDVHPNEIIRDYLGVMKDGTIKRDVGLLDHKHLVRLIYVARYWGILLKPHDIYPDLIDKNGIKNVRTKEIKEWLRAIEPSAKMRDLEDMVASLVSTPD